MPPLGLDVALSLVNAKTGSLGECYEGLRHLVHFLPYRSCGKSTAVLPVLTVSYGVAALETLVHKTLR